MSHYETNGVIQALLQAFRNQFPKAPEPRDVWSHKRREAFQREIEAYNGDDESRAESGTPNYFPELAPLKFENFIRHLLKNHRQLESVANSIHMDHERLRCESSYVEFQEETDLKSAVMRVIMAISKFEDFSSDFKTKGTKSPRELLMRRETELQVILNESAAGETPSETVMTGGYKLRDLWRDKWHPINLSLNFDMFKRYVTLIIQQRKNPLKELVQNQGHENTFKRHYLRHMYKCAESNQEFLLALISFGTDVRFYPSKVLEFLLARKMLKNNPDFRLPSNSAGVHVVPQNQLLKLADSDDLVIPKRNAEYLKKFSVNPIASQSFSATATVASKHKSDEKPLIQIVKLIDLTEDVDVDNFNDKPDIKFRNSSRQENHNTKKNSHSSSPSTAKPTPTQDVSTKPGSSSAKYMDTLPSSIVKPLSSVVKPLQVTGIIRTVTQDVKKKEPRLDFSGKPLAVAVTPEVFRDSTLKLWQMFFEPGFSLSTSIANTWYQLYVKHVVNYKTQLHNCVGVLIADRKRSCHYDIPHLHPAMVEVIKGDLNALEQSRRSGGPFNLSTVEGVMYSQTSPLQLVLHDPTINKSIPGPTGWSPTNIHMPYQAFEGHLDWRLSQIDKGLDGLEIEMIKLRYVEYLAIVFNETKQFVLGVFTAYGPDFYLYPMRVLQLLKKKQAFRAGTRLHSMIQLPVDGRSYTALVPMKSPAVSAHVSVGGGGASLLGPPPPLFDHPVIPHTQMSLGPAPFQTSHSMHPPNLNLMDAESGYGPNYIDPPPPPHHHFSYQESTQHPLDDFNPNGFAQGFGRPYENQYQDLYQHPDSQYMNPLPPPPQPVPPPSISQSGPGPDLKGPVLPSVLTMEIWKAACEKSLAKYGPKYGISGLNDNDYRVLYDRYLFDTFDNPDDFVRGILTGISLARYPRDDDDSINTSGLLNLPTQAKLQQQNSSLKPILKSQSPSAAPPIKNKSITMSRDDLLRISNLLGKLIPNASESVTEAPLHIDQERSLVDYNHSGSETGSLPSVQPRRNYEEERSFGDMRERRRVIEYDHHNSDARSNLRNPTSAEFSRRARDTFGSETDRGVNRFNPIKRPADPGDDLYDTLLTKRSNKDINDYNYR